MATKDITDLQVLRAQKKWRKNQTGPWAYEILHAETGQPLKVCYRALERAYQHGLLECGVSLRTAWFTKKGIALLDSANADVLAHADKELTDQ
jgi:hypothetical protein